MSGRFKFRKAVISVRWAFADRQFQLIMLRFFFWQAKLLMTVSFDRLFLFEIFLLFFELALDAGRCHQRQPACN